MKHSKVDRETAELDFLRFCEKNSIDIDDLDEDDTKSLEEHKSKIIKCICRGKIEVDEDGVAVYDYGSEKPLMFKEPKGSSLLAMDRVKSGQDIKGMYNLMGDITGVAPATFTKMKMSDVKNCIAITSLFLA